MSDMNLRDSEDSIITALLLMAAELRCQRTRAEDPGRIAKVLIEEWGILREDLKEKRRRGFGSQSPEE